MVLWRVFHHEIRHYDVVLGSPRAIPLAKDILLNMKSQRITLQVLLGTVNHRILLRRLNTSFGIIRGKVLEWFSSYLLGRSQRILFDGVKSDSFDLRFGVLQGSCLGPLLFVVYASKLFEIYKRTYLTLTVSLMTLNSIWPLSPTVSSRIDYCNGSLYGLPDCEITKLQRVQNAAARLLTSSRKYDHVTPVLQELHWLPVRYRIHFKILLLAFNALNGMAPAYISDLIAVRKHTRYSLGSNSSTILLHRAGKMKKKIYWW